MKLSEMRQILAERKIQLTRSLGQSFLHDINQLQRITNVAELQPNDQVLEIGPGLGPLTELLVRRAGRVLAIEKDGRLIEVLKERFANVSNLQLVHADALDYLQETRNWHDWKVVSNLPYSVGSRILIELAQNRQAPALLVVTLQLEVAQRFTASATARQAAAKLTSAASRPSGMPRRSPTPLPKTARLSIRWGRRRLPVAKHCANFLIQSVRTSRP